MEIGRPVGRGADDATTGVVAFSGELAVLPGDVNDDGVVNAEDVAVVDDQMMGSLPMTIFADIVGDGTTDTNDYNAVRRLVGTRLPTS